MTSPAQLAYSYVQRGLWLIRSADTDPRARAHRARLASAQGIEDPAVWPILFTDGDDFGKPSGAERVAAAVVCAAARHHKRGGNDALAPGVSLGTALGRLFRSTRGGTAEDAGSWNRYRQMLAVIKGHDIDAKLSDTVRLLRPIASERTIGLDYPKLAADLIRLASPDWAHQTQISWGRDYWRAVTGTPHGTAPTTTEDTTEGVNS